MGAVVTPFPGARHQEAAAEARHEVLLRDVEAAVQDGWAVVARRPAAEQSAFAVTYVGMLLGSLAAESKGGDFVGQCVAFARSYLAAVEAGR